MALKKTSYSIPVTKVDTTKATAHEATVGNKVMLPPPQGSGPRLPRTVDSRYGKK